MNSLQRQEILRILNLLPGSYQLALDQHFSIVSSDITLGSLFGFPCGYQHDPVAIHCEVLRICRVDTER